MPRTVAGTVGFNLVLVAGLGGYFWWTLDEAQRAQAGAALARPLVELRANPAGFVREAWAAFEDSGAFKLLGVALCCKLLARRFGRIAAEKRQRAAAAAEAPAVAPETKKKKKKK